MHRFCCKANCAVASEAYHDWSGEAADVQLRSVVKADCVQHSHYKLHMKAYKCFCGYKLAVTLLLVSFRK